MSIARVYAVNIVGDDLDAGTNVVTISGFDPAQPVTFSKPPIASEPRLTWDAYSRYPDDSQHGGLTWYNDVAIYGNNGGADTLLFNFVDVAHATSADAFAALAAEMPVSFSGYSTYKVAGLDDDILQNRDGLSILVEGVSASEGPGVSVFTYVADAVFTLITGTADSDYPIANLSDLFQPSKVARITPSGGAIAFKAVLSADQTVQMAAVIAHTLPDGASIQVRFYSDTGLASLVTGGDLGVVTIPTPVEGYVQTFPAVMDDPRTVRAVLVEIADAGSDPIDIGALEVAQWWALPRFNRSDVGFDDGTDDIALMGGGSWGRDEYHPTTYRGEFAYMANADGLTKGVTFLKNKSLVRPYVFVEDIGDPTTWPRTCFLALNAEMSEFAMKLYDRDSFALRAREFVR